jgi:hypothetical protein
VHHTGNKFILTSGEAQIIQAQLGQLQEYFRIMLVGLHTRLVKLEPPVPEQPADTVAQPVGEGPPAEQTSEPPELSAEQAEYEARETNNREEVSET